MANANSGAAAGAIKSQSGIRSAKAERPHRGDHVINNEPSSSTTIWFVLLVDKETPAKNPSSILNQRNAPQTKKVLRGSLLTGFEFPQSQSRGPRHYIVSQLSDDVQFDCKSSEVDRVSFSEMNLLRALSTDSQRYIVHSDKSLLTYALSLKEGNSVRVKLHQEQLKGVVRYIGSMPGGDTGTIFGIELDHEHRGKGTSDGEFNKKQLFNTFPDTALFVSVHKLIPPERLDSVPCGEEQTYKLKSTYQPHELRHFGEFRQGMTVFCCVGSRYIEGTIVSITMQPHEKEPVFAVEMSGTDGNEPGYPQQYGIKPKPNIKFVPAQDIIPQGLVENQWEEEASTEHHLVKSKHKGKKSSEPFFIVNKQKKVSPLSSAERLNKTNKPPGGKRDMSDDLYPTNRHEVRDDSLITSNYSEQSKNKSSLVGKIKGKFSSKSDSEPLASKSAQWYGDPEQAKESLSDKGNMDDNMMKEVTNAIYRDWRTIAFNLYLSKEDLEHIDRKCHSEKDRTEQMLRMWLKQKTGFDKISKLANACRTCSLHDLANELEQGLNEELLMTISGEITEGKCRPLGFNLNFSDSELDWMETNEPNLLPRVRMMLGTWRMAQSYNSDKITLLSRALHNCGLRRLELKVTRGLDDDIVSSFAVRIDTAWKVLGQNLGLSLGDIHQLEKFPREKQPYQMLLLWRKRQHRNVDVLGALYEGLKKTGLPDLASDLVQGVTDEMLDRIAISVGERWKLLGEFLGFSDAELKEISLGSNNGLRMLKLWRELHDYSSDRMTKLLKALDECGLGKIANMYRKLEESHSLEQKWSLSDVSDDQHIYKELRPKAYNLVSNEYLLKVSRKVDFQDIVRALDVSTVDAIEIENLKSTNQQRVFEVLDRWRRCGSKGQRGLGELYQVIALIGGKTHLVDDIMKIEEVSNNAVDIKPVTKELSLEAGYHSIDDVSATEVVSYPDLEVNSMVEVTHNTKSYGVIRWIGIPDGSKSVSLVAGIELETPLTNGGTDGTFNKQRYFQCEPHKALFVHLSRCRPDSRFPSLSQTFKVAKRQTSQDFGGFSSPEVPGYIDPPPSLRREFVGMQKGIQGDQNSCYLDTTLFSMFAYNTVFDPLLKRTAGQSDLPLYADVQKILRESIVNPLRQNGFVRADRVLQLREHLDNLGTTKGLMDQEKDPEEFLHTLLSEVFKSKPLLNIRHGVSKEVDHSNIYQIFTDKDESFGVPTVEQLLLQSFQDNDLKLTEVPSCLIVQMPRFGKEYKMYKRIVPSLQLDITNILEEQPRQCMVCGNLAVYECKPCKSSDRLSESVHINNYCADCFATTHSTKRSDHKPTDLFTPDAFLKDFYAVTMEKGYDEASVDQHRQLMLKPKLMDLFAVICIRTSHYVSFVKAGRESESEWVFFDSMADRQGDQQGYNIPQITHLKDLRSWVDPKNVESSEKKQLPELMTRLLGDAYICMYSNTEERKLTYV
ncbi:uncharacterized protein LOC117289348 isoform X2 [Asterias rubens]|uniref:uncharacterized protein LOC117289348 isoform X2 n=1 Tax=Asterias rubens TaxID=7604 RepID=UPI001454E763|nr:uncharacterized protein LOC117289348 isoform X2 [Asterias rubens]